MKKAGHNIKYWNLLLKTLLSFARKWKYAENEGKMVKQDFLQLDPSIKFANERKNGKNDKQEGKANNNKSKSKLYSKFRGIRMQINILRYFQKSKVVKEYKKNCFLLAISLENCHVFNFFLSLKVSVQLVYSIYFFLLKM